MGVHEDNRYNIMKWAVDMLVSILRESGEYVVTLIGACAICEDVNLRFVISATCLKAVLVFFSSLKKFPTIKIEKEGDKP